jgi:para-nitrobenzyl esterase
VHSAEIEYAMGNLSTNLVYEWTADDKKISENFLNYYANFVKTANPNGPGLPAWPLFAGDAPRKILWIDVETKAAPETDRAQYQLMDRLASAVPR